ncbi:MAG: nucleoside recognition domain-containing protein [Flavobacteriales bacterium]|nr:nucleoside recognition domain-containing protein [Flavobacteriales bacterium]MDG1439889.1 nucleoside recognition domain-containing protein [Flavobacteriales bacterium]
MTLNYIWIGFFIVAFIIAIFKTFTGNPEIFSLIVNSIFERAELGFKLSIGLTGIMALWLGIMRIGEKGGAIDLLSKAFSPLFHKLFPEVQKNSKAHGAIIMNISANMLGLDNAATPLGLKAMAELQKENTNKDRASNAQILFLVLNTSGLTLIPTSIIALRASAMAENNISGNPTDVFLPILIATFCSTIAGLILVAIIQKINLFQKTIIAYLGTAILFIGSLVYYLMNHKSQIEIISSVASGAIIFSFIIGFISLGLRKKINIYEEFVEGAKEGFTVAIRIIPYLIAMLCAVGAFTASGAMSYVTYSIGQLFSLFLDNIQFVEALPTAIMKPLSGGGARGLMVESWGENASQINSFVGRLTSTFQGSTETTFYVIAVYFGSVGIKNTRYAVLAGLFADVVGIIAAIILAYIFWG